MKTFKTTLPKASLLSDTKSDYSDSYSAIFQDLENKIGPIEVGKAFFSSAPDWVKKLFSLRNKIVSLFGLKTGQKTKTQGELLENFKGEIGEQIGLFKIYHKTDQELILGEDDKHLDFRVSLFISTQNGNSKILNISTTVQFHNLLGKLYFLPVKHFHQLIVPTMLRRLVLEIGK